MSNKEFVLMAAARIAFFGVSLAAIIISVIPARAAHTFVYVSTADNREIYVLELNEKNGSLKIVEKVTVTGMVMPLAVSPDHKFLYAALRSEPFSVSSFAINQKTGKLTLIKTTPLADNMAYISTDRTGRFLFGASYTGNKISVNAINTDGEVAPAPLQVIPTGQNAHCILTDLSNKFLFASNLGNDQLLQYRFDPSSGMLTPNNPEILKTQKGAGPRHFVFHPNGRFVFGTNELDGTVNTYLLDSAGRLTLSGSISIMPVGSNATPWAADLHLTPDGKFLYASERTTSIIAAFRIDKTSGKLTLIGTYPTETQPRGFNIDPKGKYLLAAGQKSNAISIYKINPKTGVLVKTSQIEVGQNPSWIEIITLP